MANKIFDVTPSPGIAAPTTSPIQAAMAKMRKRTLCARLFDSVTPWSHGLTVTSGQYTSLDGTLLQAISTGETGDHEPATLGASFDGGVHWIVASIMALSQYRFSGVPTP